MATIQQQQPCDTNFYDFNEQLETKNIHIGQQSRNNFPKHLRGGGSGSSDGTIAGSVMHNMCAFCRCIGGLCCRG
ncbi:unnamed protein product [Rotaria magnacalcarata]|uniref:Uncharacterized protein n=1 Tax=Rotaria magnacalcarata TaxID=392030 RepID=A0A815B8R0_9BILA|nr:unnamed protein product [Rotaria magnacalcarata]CAF4501874.1 unnamed protein product [Rotaria magnacalcarata]